MNNNTTSTNQLNEITDQTETSKAPVVFKKKIKKTNQQNIRKRTIDTDQTITEQEKHPSKSRLENHSNPQETIVKFHRRKNQSSLNPLYQVTSTSSKRLKADQSSSDELDGSDPDDNDNDDDQKAVVVSYKAQGSARQQVEENLQKSIQDRKNNEAPKDDEEDQNHIKTPSNIYLGQSKSQYQLPKGSMKYGPIKGGPTNIQTITVVDYQPDVCKDYKETGYCGFGDTCKFLHDRGDYMHGWQLDDAFNSRHKKAEVESEEEEVPFACFICRQPFNDPVVTKCKHYYCSACAIKRFAKNPKCFACGAPTGGIFNKASRVIEKMKLKQERIRKQKEEKKAEEEGLTGIEGLEEDQNGQDANNDENLGSERSFYEDE